MINLRRNGHSNCHTLTSSEGRHQGGKSASQQLVAAARRVGMARRFGCLTNLLTK